MITIIFIITKKKKNFWSTSLQEVPKRLTRTPSKVENIIQAGHKIIRTMGNNGKDATTILRHKIHLKEL